jgi:hypothetical protein
LSLLTCNDRHGRRRRHRLRTMALWLWLSRGFVQGVPPTRRETVEGTLVGPEQSDERKKGNLVQKPIMVGWPDI